MARREMAQALTRVMERKHEVAAVEGSLMQVAYREANNSFTFSNKDLVNQVVDGDWPLYITAFLGHLKLKGLIDTGASTNILPLLTFDALGYSDRKNYSKTTTSSRNRNLTTEYPWACVCGS